MIKALMIKELRETLGVAVIGLALFTAFIGSMTGMPFFKALPGMPQPTGELPLLGYSFRQFFAFLTAGLAVALGFWQTVSESNRGTFPFLLHRPLARQTIIGAKLATGLAVLLVEAGGAILVYALWAATPGTHPAPFFWSMATFSAQIALAMTVIYLGAFLSGLRPARWVGTRLLPLAGCAFITALLAFLTYINGPLGASLIVVSDVLLIAAVMGVAYSRDYA
jgi:ABC-type transport system involved in multi-copper enzyme maturation permease subunit